MTESKIQRVILSKDGVEFEAHQDISEKNPPYLYLKTGRGLQHIGFRTAWEGGGWTVTPAPLTLREKIEALPVGTRFLVHCSAGDVLAPFYRRPGGVAYGPHSYGNWDWIILRNPNIRIEVIKEGEFL